MQNWYIKITEENRDELVKWWEDKVGKSDYGAPKINQYLMSENPEDDSYYWSQQDTDKYGLYWKKDYELITLEQFRKITNPTQVKTHPEKWYIIATKENYDELSAWRKTAASSKWNNFKIGHSLLSKHPSDSSYYYGNPIEHLKSDPAMSDYQEITLEQFRQITSLKPMSETTPIQISRKLLNEYYEASTISQKEYLSEHFKLNGWTTIGAIRVLYELACSEWKPTIKANHPDCFEPESKEFNFENYVAKNSKCILKANANELGLGYDFIQIRVDKYSDYYHKGFYLDGEYNWELITDNKNEIVLVPTKK